jgi:hypothetical protein
MEDLIGEVISLLEDNPNSSRMLENLIGRNDAITYFLRGGCYQLAKVITYFVKNSTIVVNEELTHCAVMYKNNLYDARGRIKDSNRYKVASNEDLLYMEERFGFDEDFIRDKNKNYVKPSVFLISNLTTNYVLKRIKL